jgi:GNAT superfamily N-acetyltransferase
VAVVAPIEPTQVEAIAALVEEMDRFYGAAGGEPLDARIRQINQALFSDPPAAYALLAWNGDEPVGFAAYSFLWPAVGLTRSLYLKELYVTEAARRSGVGKQLMRALFETAVKLECSRVEWTTDRENVDAQTFYELLGVRQNTAKLFYRLEGEQLRRAADGQ